MGDIFFFIILLIYGSNEKQFPGQIEVDKGVFPGQQSGKKTNCSFVLICEQIDYNTTGGSGLMCLALSLFPCHLKFLKNQKKQAVKITFDLHADKLERKPYTSSVRLQVWGFFQTHVLAWLDSV